MKKAFLIILLNALLAAPAAWSASLSPDEALARLSVERYRSPSLGKIASTDFTLTATVDNLYIFSGKTGFIVVPDDDCAPALLGYSENSAFDAQTNPNLAYWLEFLNDQLYYLKDNPQSAVAGVSRTDRRAISPMITTMWNQGSPYNDDCPVYNGYRCVTGCVATAMAQVLKYHNYPEQGTGVASYTWNNQKLSFDYGTTTFEWDLMTDTYDSSSSEESMAVVAKLMYACGVSVNMHYSHESSGASSLMIPGALINHFNYDKGVWLAQRNAFGIFEWEELIYNELNEGRPVIYSGQSSGGGHEFVCDGYASDGYFHFNWGWGGMSDGYFLLTALSPGSLGTGGGAGGYNFNQDAVIGVMRPREDSMYKCIMYNVKDFAPESETATLGSDCSFIGAFMNGGVETMHAITPGVKFLNTADNSVSYASAPYIWSNLEPSYYYDGMTVELPATLPEGDYVVTPVFSIADGEWQDMHSYITVTGYLNAKVEDSTVTFTAPQGAAAKVIDITVEPVIYISLYTPLSFTVTNPGTEEFIGNVIPSLFNEDGKLTAHSAALSVDLLGGASQRFTDISAAFRAVGDDEFVAGNYQLVFCDGLGNKVSEPIDVAVAYNHGPATVGVTEFSLISDSPVYDKSAVKFNVGVECSEGYFTNSLRIVIFPYTSGNVTSVYSADTPMFYLGAGKSEIKETILDLSSLDNGKYFAMLYLGNQQASGKQIIFELAMPVSGIDAVGADSDATEEIYNIFGIKCSRPLAPGVYIINGVKTLVK